MAHGTDVLEQPTRSRAEAEAHAVIARGVRERRPVFAYCDGQLVVLCPHALGRRGTLSYVLGFGYFDIDRHSATVPCSWRWLRVASLQQVEIRGNFWLTAPRDTRPSTYFLDAIDEEVRA
jgi:hypothetical protein